MAEEQRHEALCYIEFGGRVDGHSSIPCRGPLVEREIVEFGRSRLLPTASEQECLVRLLGLLVRAPDLIFGDVFAAMAEAR